LRAAIVVNQRQSHFSYKGKEHNEKDSFKQCDITMFHANHLLP